MSVIDRLRPRRPAAPPLPPPPGAGGAPAPASAPDDLLERRDRLGREFAELQWDLGGLTYEMAIRDHFRLDVLVRAAARLQDVDAQLGETERLVRLESAGATGSCSSCGALHSRGATFCWSCGARLLEPLRPDEAASA